MLPAPANYVTSPKLYKFCDGFYPKCMLGFVFGTQVSQQAYFDEPSVLSETGSLYV